MKRFLIILLPWLVYTAQAQQVPKLVLPNAQQLQWAAAEIGAIIHFDLVNYVPGYDWRNWGTHPPASVFNPSKLDTDQWVRAAKAAGASYVVLVAKHCSGFSLWPTAAHPYSVKNAPWKNGKGDIVKDFIASCKKYHVKPGIYASAAANGYCYVDNPGLVQKGSPFTQKQYNDIVIQQLTELWTNYGKLFEIWFDGGVLPVEQGGPPIAALLKKFQPDAIVFQGPVHAKNLVRWIGNEEGAAPYPNWGTSDATTSATGTIKAANMSGDPDGKIWCPGEADFPLRTGWQGGWFWKASGQKMRSPEQLLRNYNTSVGRNANMLLGIVIDTSGQVPAEDVARLTWFGKAVKERFARPVFSGKANGTQVQQTIARRPVAINCMVLQEDIAKGERIRHYALDAWVNNGWKQIAEGSSVGHKRIQEFDPVYTTRVRLRITGSVANPVLKNMAFYYMEDQQTANVSPYQ
ncbi:alpha-L-fucosidase [Niabella hirudinis]|uniref:alpha-L-fucosidase n=1 Tax=Niabella hirudinis TaxID=1285929 RepID=UPI003EB87796